MLSSQWWWVKWRGGGASPGLELVAAVWVLPYQNWRNKLCGRKLLLTEPAFNLKIRKKNKQSPEEDRYSTCCTLSYKHVIIQWKITHTHTHTQDANTRHWFLLFFQQGTKHLYHPPSPVSIHHSSQFSLTHIQQGFRDSYFLAFLPTH